MHVECPGGQRQHMSLVELEFQVGVNCYVNSGNLTWVSAGYHMGLFTTELSNPEIMVFVCF